MPKINYNERSWAIDLISEINLWTSGKNVPIKRAGGENTLKENKKSLFPDVLLFGDEQKGRVVQGWELKMPDTDINDVEFIRNAKKKAELLSLNSFLLWNVSVAILYKIKDDRTIEKVKSWDGLSHIRTRDEVERNSALIRTELHKILNDLNDFIQNGVIKATSILEVLNSEQVSELINKNLGTYIASIKNQAIGNTDIEAEADIWWRYAKNDYPEEEDKYVVLAKINLLYLINKFLFAHILKSYQEEASRIDTISSDTTLAEGLAIFQSISEKVDFWNIFQTQAFEKYISAEVWNDMIDFNGFLKSFNFQSIEKNLLHDLIGHTVYRNKRKFAGQFTTPPELAKLIVGASIKNKRGIAIDPCCGSGTIAREIFLEKKSAIGIDQALETTWASDKFALPLQMAMFNMADPEAMGKLIQVFKEDATKLEIGKVLELRDPFNGKLVKKSIPAFDYIISNLPFVRQEDLEILNPNTPEINTFIEARLGPNRALDGKSDLYAYLPFYFWKILNDDGILAFIISNSWLGTKWGERFYENLNAFYKIDTVITSGNGKWFDNADVVTNIVILKKKTTPRLDEEEKTKFVVTKKILKTLTQEQIKEMTAVISLREIANEDDVLVNSYTYKQTLALRSFGLNLNSLFTDNNWIISLKPFLINASSLFEIARGERRGWDALFYPNGNTPIEDEFLKPVLKTPRSIENLITQPDAMAFCCTKSIEELQRDGNNGALSWIRSFEDKTNGTGKLLPIALQKAGTNWYTMTPDTMGEIVTSINFGDRLFFAKFPEQTFVNQRLVRFTRKDPNTNLELCHALLNSTLGLFYIEALGTGRGQGALDISKDKIEKDLLMFNPTLFNEAQKTDILIKFEIIKQRSILHLEDELAQEDRNDLDEAILSAIGLLEIKESIKKALLDLYHIRNCVKN
jgi:hypothetical protein